MVTLFVLRVFLSARSRGCIRDCDHVSALGGIELRVAGEDLPVIAPALLTAAGLVCVVAAVRAWSQTGPDVPAPPPPVASAPAPPPAPTPTVAPPPAPEPEPERAPPDAAKPKPEPAPATAPAAWPKAPVPAAPAAEAPAPEPPRPRGPCVLAQLTYDRGTAALKRAHAAPLDRTSALSSLGFRAADELERGDVEQVMVRGKAGFAVIFQASENTLLLVLASKAAKLGLIFLDTQRSAQQIDKIL